MNRIIVSLSYIAAVLALGLGPALAGPFVPVGSLDLGRPGDDPVAAGSFIYNDVENSYTVSGGGSDWWDAGEYAHFVYQPISGDFWFEGSVLWLGTTSPDGQDRWVKAGLAVRNNLLRGAGNERQVNYLMAHLRPDNREVAFQGRTTQGASMFNYQMGGVPDQPVKVALNRWTDAEGDVLVQGYVDRGSGWNLVSSTWAPNIAHNAFVGLAVTAHRNDGRLDTAKFSDLQILGAVTPSGPLPRKRGALLSPPETLTPVEGGWAVLEVLDNGDMHSISDAIRSLDSDRGLRHLYTRMGAINIKDGASGDAKNFPGDGNYGVADAGLRGNGSVDHIAFLARGKILIPESDWWSFYINSDDGEELSVGNRQLVIGSERAYDSNFGSVWLDAGVYDIQVIHREAGGFADIEVAAARGRTTNLAHFRLIGSGDPGSVGRSYRIPGFKDGEVNIETTAPGLSPGPGNRDQALQAIAAGRLAGTNLTSIADRVYHGDWYWYTDRWGAYGERLRWPNDVGDRDEDNFAFLAEGTLSIPHSGTWYLGFESDDGGALWIEGANWLSIVENRTGQGTIDGEWLKTDAWTGNSRTVGEIHLEAGEYDFKFVGYEGSGGAYMQLIGSEVRGQYGLLSGTGYIGGYIEQPAAPALRLVPEPSTWVLLAVSGLLGLFAVVRRR